MELLKKTLNTINKYSMLSEPVCPSGRGDHILIGLSGGADSVCLTFILADFKDDFNLTLNAVYVDHGLRPDEAENEKAFCKGLCDNLGIGFFSKAVDVKKYAKDKKLSKQDAARELRYQVYEEISRELNATKIALGHTADDQAETFLMRLLRGAGMRGLSGIPPVRDLGVRARGSGVRGNILIIRPLIEVERKDIEEFLAVHCSLPACRRGRFTVHSSLPFMVDSSNLKKDYFRNWVRHVVIPELKGRNPSLIENLCRTAEILREEDAYLEFIVTKTLMRLISRKDDDIIELFLLPLKTMDKVILRRVLRRAIDETKGLKGIDFSHIEDIISLIKDGKSGDRLYLPKGIKAIKSYSTLVLTSEIPERLETRIFNPPGELFLDEISIVLNVKVSDVPEKSFDGRDTAVFDFDRLTLPLKIRSRKEGDYFYPSGFGKRKKLQDFFVDSKIPRDERDTIPLVVSGEDIIWIMGYRMDKRFRAKENTKRFLVMKCFKR